MPMGKELEGRVALVTGGASGIGKAIAEKFAAHGAKVAVVDIDFDGANSVAGTIREAGGIAEASQCDVQDEAQIRKVVETVRSQLGAIQILVNNAGISPMQVIESIRLEEWERVMRVNLTSAFLFTQACLADLKQAGAKGRIIQMGSLAGQVGGIAVGLHYTASKGGLMAMTKQMAKLLAPYAVTVNNIAPGTTDTPLIQDWPDKTREELKNRIPLGRLGTVDDVASTALFLASDDASFITGATINVNGGMFIN